MKYRVHLRGDEYVEVEGIPVRFADFHEFSFIAHKCPFETNETLRGLWHVSEVETGRYFASSHTLNLARQEAKRELLDEGRNHLRKCIKAFQLAKG